jgi:3',5'-cyclic AMP phosphodiesterase CpdA
MTNSSRRDALKCLAFGGAGTLFALSGGVPVPMALAAAATQRTAPLKPFFVQISDSHIGFAKDANPDVKATLQRTIDIVNALPERPSLVLHTGDITHLSKAQEFDAAQQLLSGLRVGELHATPGEHDVIDGVGQEFFSRFGKASNGRGYYSFDAAGVHFVALVNVMQFKAGGLGALGGDQLDWLAKDLAGVSASAPVVVFAHMPLWTIYEPWGWGTEDADRAMALLRRFGSVTVLNGHIHQIVQRTEGHIVFHTARSTAYPQPTAGDGPGPGPLKVAPERLAGMLGFSSLAISGRAAALEDSTLA